MMDSLRLTTKAALNLGTRPTNSRALPRNPVNCFDVIYERRPSGIKMETLFAVKRIIFVRIIVQSRLPVAFEMKSLFISLWRTTKPGRNGNVIVPSHLVFMLLSLLFAFKGKPGEEEEIFFGFLSAVIICRARHNVAVNP
jgi:hypothetical protein